MFCFVNCPLGQSGDGGADSDEFVEIKDFGQFVQRARLLFQARLNKDFLSYGNVRGNSFRVASYSETDPL
jgi:hypothetical protein